MPPPGRRGNKPAACADSPSVQGSKEESDKQRKSEGGSERSMDLGGIRQGASKAACKKWRLRHGGERDQRAENGGGRGASMVTEGHF